MMTSSIDEMKDKLRQVRKHQFDTINETYGEQTLYENGDGITVYYTNPYTTDTISIMECLTEIKDIIRITVIPAEDKDDDYDLIKVEWRT